MRWANEGPDFSSSVDFTPYMGVNPTLDAQPRAARPSPPPSLPNPARVAERTQSHGKVTTT
jgi:hypothetical protein